MKVLIVHIEDWYGLYLDEKLVAQGHSLQPEDLLDHMQVEHTSTWLDDKEDLCELVEQGDMPPYAVLNKYLEP